MASLLTEAAAANPVDVEVVASAEEAVDWMLIQPEIRKIVNAPF